MLKLCNMKLAHLKQGLQRHNMREGDFFDNVKVYWDKGFL